jgi:hypothetical protein
MWPLSALAIADVVLLPTAYLAARKLHREAVDAWESLFNCPLDLREGLLREGIGSWW